MPSVPDSGAIVSILTARLLRTASGIAAAVATVAILIPSAASETRAVPAGSQLLNGKRLYREYCGQCHALSAALAAGFGNSGGGLGENGGPSFNNLRVPYAYSVEAVTEPTGGHANPEAADWLSALLAFGGAVALLTAVAMRGSPLRRTVAFALAGALAWALMAVFLKATTDTISMFGVLGMLSRWPVYALAAAALAGTLLEQAALHAGPLSVSQPLLIVVNPLASIVLSVWLFEEQFTSSPARIAIAAVSFAAMAVGVVELSRRAPQTMAPSRPAATGAASS